jgi:outer membrane lipoprotein-sorting protein
MAEQAHTRLVSTADLLHPSRRLLAWTAPVVVVAAIAAGAAVVSASSASGHPSLPRLTPAQLLAKVQTASAPALSGVVRESAALGLPDLPGSDQSASLSWTSLITGTHTAKVWLDGADKQRVALLGTLSEADVVHNGRDLWTYTSGPNEVSHTVLPTDRSARHQDSGDDNYTPIGAAKELLKAVDPSTVVRVGQTRVVAGRDAYTLVISPRNAGSTVRDVTIAVDSTRFIPLQLDVFGAGSNPAFQIGFTQISFATPKAATFNFSAPAGATVVANPLQGRHFRDHTGAPRTGSPSSGDVGPKVLGSGWTTVVELSDGLPGGASSGLLDRLTRPGPTSGERVLTTALINGLLLPDGRTFIGAVTPGVLEHVAATTPR